MQCALLFNMLVKGVVSTNRVIEWGGNYLKKAVLQNFFITLRILRNVLINKLVNEIKSTYLFLRDLTFLVRF